MSHNHAAMGGMSMDGLPTLFEFPHYYWAVVGSVVGVATLANIYNHVLCNQRLAAARAGLAKPAKPTSWIPSIVATLYAVTREFSNFSYRIPIKDRIVRLPTFGRTSLIVGNLIVLLVLCFYGFDLNARWKRQDIGYRCGFVTIAQIPLIFLLAGKNNIIGYLSGISHERLNWLHRWCARCMLLTATLHMGYLFADWAPYDYIGTQIKENPIVQKGMVAWVMLVWIVFSSMTPIRGWSYEVFVLQHLVSFAVFIGFVYIHTPAEVHGYIWAPVAIFWFDRVVRAMRVVYANLSFFHPKTQSLTKARSLWACQAEFVPLPHQTTRIIIKDPPISWTPGQHVFLSCHSIVPLQSHPFTVASIPSDGKMEFLVKSEAGGTKRFFRHAEKTHGLPASSGKSCIKTVAVEGPYGCLRPLRQFDSVVLLAGSTGATFTMPLLRDILRGWTENADLPTGSSSLFQTRGGAVTRSVRFVWVVKSRGQLGWFSDQLSTVCAEFQSLQERLRDIKLELTVYVTCDDTFTEEHKTLLSTFAALNPDAPIKKEKEPEHGTVEIRNRNASLDEPEKKKAKFADDSREEITELTRINTLPENAKTCGPNGTCCCKTTVDEEDQDEIAPCCCCGPSTSAPDTPRRSNGSSMSVYPPKLLMNPSIAVFGGRPNPRNIIRKSLEQAMGESAVVVCGPQGLVADVKRDVVSLSDERAVHKGTGAQGIYLHTESFGY
ncbi:ferric-chelate reductase [Aaosphaeria arxii CBS 175.79]|uniref:ferric-chelate reductase (NADPH) n=1 Tax=Aaosphaeria arxii CBS 175.79 TaxID=1450172 RepID=A0A6A5XXK8_9PLEO|nr:ferric-chelate reductase [Aaosphaeria arxii CBS 175.79]KAF2017461.1 ferric-chelate reductase [Aaosphaeria arxii CBS 175.79]